MKQELHILFTGVGRRIELVQAYRNAAIRLNINLKIYGADMLGTAPALKYCDYVRKVCGMKKNDYIPQLLEICKKDSIDIIIPTIDTDLLVLSENKKIFEDNKIKVLISNYDSIMICRDKNNTSDFFVSCGLKAPKTYNDYKRYDAGFPCFIKPKDGSSSINAFKVNNQKELETYSNLIDDYVIQPFVDGREYTIDIFCDFNSNPVYIVPRERVAVRAGEVLKTRICMDNVMIREAKALINKFKPIGPITVQLIQDKSTGENYYIEINPRYGGGAPLSIKAGADSPEVLLRLLCDSSLSDINKIISDEAVFCRFDQSVCINKGTSCRATKGIIFDLDDTLYNEIDYVKSGFVKVSELFENSEEIYTDLIKAFYDKKPTIDSVLTKYNMLNRKQECIDVYREQLPNISLSQEAKDTLLKIKSLGLKIGVITDGRVEGQKQKIKALGIEEFVDDIIITDELGGEQFRKPNDISFRIMQNRWKLPFETLTYVGDNVNKDFIAPEQLGMDCVYLDNKDGIYNIDSFEDESVKKVNSIFEVIECLGVEQ